MEFKITKDDLYDLVLKQIFGGLIFDPNNNLNEKELDNYKKDFIYFWEHNLEDSGYHIPNIINNLEDLISTIFMLGFTTPFKLFKLTVS